MLDANGEPSIGLRQSGSRFLPEKVECVTHARSSVN
jgi:hypothetical protein